MNRDTKTIITPIDKIEVVIKSWITGKEKREIRNVFLSKMKLSGEQNTTIEQNPAELTEEAENKTIEMIVISINGKTDNLLDDILNMKSKDYDFIVKEINNISRDTDFLG